MNRCKIACRNTDTLSQVVAIGEPSQAIADGHLPSVSECLLSQRVKTLTFQQPNVL